jgi:RNA 2',3'-cyclic 3'-phosphodiesterase
MRLFIGIGLPASVAEVLARSARSLIPPAAGPKLRWTPHANMHITLSFLGPVHDARRDAIEQALVAIRAPRFHVELDGIGTFERVGVLFAGVKHTSALVALAGHVIAAMETIGFPREERPYSPHVTLARTRDRLHLRSNPPDDPAFRQRFDAIQFRLYQSLTLPGGAQYQVLRSFPLD